MHNKELQYNRDMRNKLIFILLTLCAASISRADDPYKYQPKLRSKGRIDMSLDRNKAFLEKDLGISDEDLVSLGNSEIEFRKLRNDIISLPKIDSGKLKNPYPAYRALIKRGSRLYSMNLNEVYLVSRDTIAMANEITKGGSLAFIYNKNGEAKYIAVSKSIEKIEEHFDLNNYLDATLEYKRTYKHKIQDYNLELEHSFNMHFEDVKAIYFAEVFNGTSTGGRANRVEYRVFFPWEFPIEFGLSTSFQDGRYDNFSGTQVADWNAVYAGSYIRTKLLEEPQSYRFHALFGIEKSLYFDVSESFQMSTNLWSAIGELEYQIGKEKILFSIGYRSMRGHIDRSIIGDITQNATRRRIQSIDFSIGYRFGQFL